MDLYTIDPSLNWDVETQPLYSETRQLITGYKRLIHSENRNTLHICKDSYTPILNGELTTLANQLADNYGFELEGFADFKGGKKVLAYLKNTNMLSLAGFPSADYLIIGNSHDGSTCFFVGASNYMYRCTNMFTSTKQHWKLNHRSGYKQKLEDLVEVYDLYFNEKTQMYEQINRMADTSTDEQNTAEFIDHVLQIGNPKEISRRMQTIRGELQNSIATECAELGQNAFGLFNGATHYTTHVLNSKNNMFGNPFGHANTLNQRAFNYCANLLESQPIQHAMPHF